MSAGDDVESGAVSCEVCGNEIDDRFARCPHCGSKRVPGQHRRPPGFRIVNLEKGMPPADRALQRMQDEIESGRLLGDPVLIFIHGYGSSGRGGIIRDEARRRLEFLAGRGMIGEFLPGEKCDRRSGRFRHLVRRFPVLNRLVKRPNPGITVVIL